MINQESDLLRNLDWLFLEDQSLVLIISRYIFSRIISSNLLRTFSMLSFLQPAITCSKLTIETLEQGLKYVPS